MNRATRRLALCLAVGLLALPGCGRHHRQEVRPGEPPLDAAAVPDEEKKPVRVINGESPTVLNWATGDR